MKQTILFILFCYSFSLFAEEGDKSLARVWATGSTEKVLLTRRAYDPHDNVWDENTKTVFLTGVRGEKIPFHLIVTHPGKPVTNVTLDIEDLKDGKNVLSKELIRPYLEYLVNVYAATGAEGSRGNWPDALVPLTRPFSMNSNWDRTQPRNQPLWIDIEVPRDQPPGTYTSEIKVNSDQGYLGSVNISLKVVDIVLPMQRTIPCHIGYWENHMARVHGMEQDSEEFRKLYWEYLIYLLDNRMDPRTPVATSGKVVDGEYILSWPRPELEELFIEKGRVHFVMSIVPHGDYGVGREDPFTDEYKKIVRQHVTQVIEHAKEKGWYDKLIFWVPVDEPKSAHQYEAVRRWADAVREVDSNVPVSVTEQPQTENPEWGTLVGHANSWTVNGNYLINQAESIIARDDAGELVNWYVSCDQGYPMPNYYIDREAADLRMIPWITWRYKLDGILYWTASFWAEIVDPWLDPVNWKWFPCGSPAAGEGSLVYPGDMAERYAKQDNVHGPVGSLRLALLREGLEEFELLNMLKSLGGEEIADEITKSICTAVNEFSRNPVEIDGAREKVIEAILRLKSVE